MVEQKKKVFIVDEEPVFRQGIRYCLSSVEDIEVSGEVGFSDKVIPAIEASPPDVVLIDIDGSSLRGLELARQIKKCLPSVAIIMLTSEYDDNQLFEAIKAQVMAYTSKKVAINELVNVIRRTAQGEYLINQSLAGSPKVAEKVLREFQELTWGKGVENVISPLTSREMEVLNYMAQGHINKQIAAEMGIAEQTLKNHVSSILRKLNANARTQAVVVAIKRGLISIAKE